MIPISNNDNLKDPARKAMLVRPLNFLNLESSVEAKIYVGSPQELTTGDAANTKSFSWGDPIGRTFGVGDWIQNSTATVTSLFSGTSHAGTTTADCWQIKEAGKLTLACAIEFVGSLYHRDVSYVTSGHYKMFTPTFRCGFHNLGSGSAISFDPAILNEQFQLYDNVSYIPDDILLTSPGNSISGNNNYSASLIFSADVAVDDRIVFGMGPTRRASAENVSITVNHYWVRLD